MKQIFRIALLFVLYLSVGFTNKITAQSSWKTHFENGKVKIEYRLQDCKSTANDTDFSYYLTRFTNKTKSKLNVQFDTAPKLGAKNVDAENFNSFILNPAEVKEGNCTSTQRELRQYFQDNKKSKGSAANTPLLILNIKTYEL